MKLGEKDKDPNIFNIDNVLDSVKEKWKKSKKKKKKAKAKKK